MVIHMKSSPELVLEYQKTKNAIKKAVQTGTQFIFNCMVDGKVPSYSPSSRKFGLWPAAEMANFLISNQILPKTCSSQIDFIIDFLLSKFKSFSDGTGAWHATVNGTKEYYSSQTTGYCAYVLKLYYNEFLADDRRNKIKDIISQAEKYIVSQQQDAGFWTPSSSSGDTMSKDGINYSDFFYSYYSYFGIKASSQYDREESAVIDNALAKAKNYFYNFALNLIQSYNTQEITDSAKIVLLSNVSKVLQVLNDFDDENLTGTVAELHRISLEIFDIVNKNDFTCSSVTLDRLDAESQRTYHNNTPFDVYFALREEKISAKNLLLVVEWYLKHQDIVEGCWYLNADANTNQSTWTTIEALLVLSDAYDMISEELYLRELQSFDVQQKEYDQLIQETKNERATLSGKGEKYKQALDSSVKLIKKRNNILMGFSVGISILISIVGFIVLLIVVTKGIDSTMETVINVVLFGLGVNAIFQGIIFIVQAVKKKVKELDDLLEESNNINLDKQ